MITRGRHNDRAAASNWRYDRIPAGQLVRVEFSCYGRPDCGNFDAGFLIVKQPVACRRALLLACASALLSRRCAFIGTVLRFFLEGLA